MKTTFVCNERTLRFSFYSGASFPASSPRPVTKMNPSSAARA